MREWLSWYFQWERRWRSLRRGTRGRWRRRCRWAGRWARWACWPPWRPSPSRTSNGRRRRRRRRCRGVGTPACAMLDSLPVQVVVKGVWALWAATRGSIGQVRRVWVFGESKQCEKRRHPDVKGYQIHSFDRWDQQLWFRWSLVKQSYQRVWIIEMVKNLQSSLIQTFLALLRYCPTWFPSLTYIVEVVEIVVAHVILVTKLMALLLTLKFLGFFPRSLDRYARVA